jgi:hypothetical protein
MGPTHLGTGRSTFGPKTKGDSIPVANWVLHGHAAFRLPDNLAGLGLTPCAPLVLGLAMLAYHRGDP